MKLYKKIGFLTVLIVATLLAQNASADMLLPISTYAQQNGWWGYGRVTTDGFDLMVRFAVYDILDPTFQPDPCFPGEFPWEGVKFPEGDRYIYAYQILNYTGEEVGLFKVVNLNKSGISQSIMHATHSQSNNGGYATDPVISEVQGVWVFPDGLPQGTRSWFLALSSNQTPKIGSFKIAISDDFPVPGDGLDVYEFVGNFPVPVPEPATIVFLFAGMSSLIKYRRKRVMLT